MKKTIKGFLIDPFSKNITEITVAQDDRSFLKDMRKHIQCDVVDCVQFNDGSNDLWVDDEGLLQELPEPKFIFIDLCFPGIYAGRGIVLAPTPDGDTTDATITLEELKKHVKFLDAYSAKVEHARVMQEAGIPL